MCGRYVLKREDLDALLRQLGVPDISAFTSRYNLAPTSLVPIVRGPRPRRTANTAQWGLVPPWAASPGGSRLANARAESIAARPAFREAFQRRRCVVPASGFYEWETRGGRKLPWYFTPRDGPPLALAGIWEEGTDAAPATCALITTEACPEVARIHDRMPVALPREAAEAWLDPDQPAPALLPLLRPLPAGVLAATRVSTRVNQVRHEGPDCLAPEAETAAEEDGQLGLAGLG
jgi:putative SOS response-associated peptidase YedK